jgi:DNA-directed RNA polymerase
MTKEERLKALSHNSNHYQYNNTLKIATLFVDHKFYLPTFADFRGRIYTYSNYLSYQGTDLARSLIFFDKGDNEITNEAPKDPKEEINKVEMRKFFEPIRI